MAISQALPLVIFLVSSLLIVPAFSDTRFQSCNTGEDYPVKVKTVKISPDPVKRRGNANITITGYTNKEIRDGAIVTLGLSLPMIPVSSKRYSLCDITACPVSPGPILLTFSNVFTKEELRSRAYYVVISITEDEEQDQMMCVVFTCKIRASMLHQATE